MMLSFFSHSLDNLICGNLDLLNFHVDVMIGLFLVDVGIVFICYSSYFHGAIASCNEIQIIQ
jgi:hypothetical protein